MQPRERESHRAPGAERRFLAQHADHGAADAHAIVALHELLAEITRQQQHLFDTVSRDLLDDVLDEGFPGHVDQRLRDGAREVPQAGPLAARKDDGLLQQTASSTKPHSM